MILLAFLEEMEEVLQRRTRSRRLTTLKEEAGKVLALLVRQLFLASRDWSLARRIGSPDPRQLLEWRVVVHALQELADLFGETLSALNEETGKLPATSRDLLAAHLPELKAELKAVVEALMHPSLDHACETHHRSLELGRVWTAPGRATRKGKGGTPPIPSTGRLLQRATGHLAHLAGVAIDRAVAAGTETILVEAA